MYVNVNSRRLVQLDCNAYWATAVAEMGCYNKSLIVNFGTVRLAGARNFLRAQVKGATF